MSQKNAMYAIGSRMAANVEATMPNQVRESPCQIQNQQNPMAMAAKAPMILKTELSYFPAISANAYPLINVRMMIDLAAAEGLYPGQFATVFRDNAVTGMPRIIIGEVGVLTVEDHYSTVVISRSYAPLHVGDRIEMK